MVNPFTSDLGLESLLCKLNQQPSHLMKISMLNQQSSQGVRTSFLFCFLSVYILGFKKFIFSEKHVFYFMPCQHQAWSVRAIKRFMLSQHLFQKITNIFQGKIICYLCLGLQSSIPKDDAEFFRKISQFF